MSDIFAALHATWPAASTRCCGPFTLRDGAGGGKRVSAATLDGPLHRDALDAALRQTPLVMVRDGQTDLDSALAERGWRVVDPTVLIAAPVAALAARPAALALLPVWPTLAIQRQIWAEAGIGPDRVAVMARAPQPATSFIARLDNRTAGTAFAAVHHQTAMLHALEVLPTARRRGVGAATVRGIADWAAGQGAGVLALAVTRANTPARALYARLGMTEAGGYHYRQAPDPA